MKFYTTNNKTNYTYCLKSCIVGWGEEQQIHTSECVGQNTYTTKSNRKMETIAWGAQ